MNRLLCFVLLAAVLPALAACGGEQQPPASRNSGASRGPAATPRPTPPAPPAAPAELDPAQLAERGRTVYMTNCIACHNPDPSQDGALGPAVSGATPELLEARVIRGEYPAGYAPKRDTRVMVPFPFLEKDVGALAAYLADPGSV